jgi:hypothetical protein
VIVYLWTAVPRGAAVPRASFGISDDAGKARDAAGQCLRDGRAQFALVETALTETFPLACYRRTGTGWCATPGRAGQVRWARFTSPDTAGRLRALVEEEAGRNA